MSESLMVVDPKKAVSLSQVAADACRHLLESCIVSIPSRKGGPPSKHMRVEGWSMIASAHGLTTGCDEPVRMEDKAGRFIGYRVRGWVRNQAGVEVGSAWGMVTATEDRWARAPEFQVCSMAQTRAVGKACRLALGHVVAFLKIEGLDACPYEEIVHEAPAPAPAPAVKPRPAPETAHQEHGVLNTAVADEPPFAQPPDDPFPADAVALAKATPGQLKQIKELAPAGDYIKQMLTRLGRKSGAEMTFTEAEDVIASLMSERGMK